MANVEIHDIATARDALPDDEVEVQAAGGGASARVPASSLINVAKTDANATLSSSATVTGSGDATVGMVAQTATGTAAANLGAQALTLGNATFQLGVYAVEGTATAAVGSAANTGNAVTPVSATSYIAGNATANTTATATTGDATANTTATATDGNATADVKAHVTDNGFAAIDIEARAETGQADVSLRAATAAHVAGIAAIATDDEAALEIDTGDDQGAAGQFIGSDGAGKVLWQTPLVRHAAGVPTGAPGVAELPFAFDSTAVTGGLYFWDGAAWVKVATIL